MDPIDNRIDAQMRRIRATVLEAHGYGPNDDVPESQIESSLDEVARLATINAHWGIVSTAPVVGRFVVLWRRALRILLRWYINPIVEQQNDFNQAVLRALYELKFESEESRMRGGGEHSIDSPSTRQS